MGRFACSTREYRKGLDANGEERRSIVFQLIQPAEGMQEVEPPAFPLADTDINVLRERAYGAASQAEKRDTREAKRLYRERSSAVREYVLARANGSCEACGEAAPFQRPAGAPYLEPRHTTKISDGGPESPSMGRSRLPQVPQGTPPRTGRRGQKLAAATLPGRVRVLTAFVSTPSKQEKRKDDLLGE